MYARLFHPKDNAYPKNSPNFSLKARLMDAFVTHVKTKFQELKKRVGENNKELIASVEESERDVLGKVVLLKRIYLEKNDVLLRLNLAVEQAEYNAKHCELVPREKLNTEKARAIQAVSDFLEKKELDSILDEFDKVLLSFSACLKELTVKIDHLVEPEGKEYKDSNDESLQKLLLLQKQIQKEANEEIEISDEMKKNPEKHIHQLETQLAVFKLMNSQSIMEHVEATYPGYFARR